MKKITLLSILLVVPIVSAFCQKWLHFPATNNNRVDIGNLAVTGDSITVEALISFQFFAPPLDAYDIISKHTNSFDCSYLFRPTDFAIRTTAGFTSVPNPVTLCYDSVYHVAASYNGDSLMYFLNGKRVAAIHHTGAIEQNNHVTGIGNVTAALNFNEQFIGYLDEVRIWKTARTEAQIEANMYDLPNPATQAGLVAYYKFDDSYLNLQGNAQYNGTPSGALVLNEFNSFYHGRVAEPNCGTTEVVNHNDRNRTSFSQNFPNPFSSETVISCYIPEETKNASLEIYAMDGRKVQQIRISGTGKQDISITRKVLPTSGVYFYSLLTDGQMQPLKQILGE